MLSFQASRNRRPLRLAASKSGDASCRKARRRDRQADELAVVVRRDPQIRVHDGALDVDEEILLPGLDRDESRIRDRQRRQAFVDVDGADGPAALQISERLRAQTSGLDQAIENGYLGLRNGILDQSAILYSHRDHLTSIDCTTGQHSLIPKPESLSFSILIAFSGIQTALVSTGYNSRVEECAEAAATLLHACQRPDVPQVLGNVSPEEYAMHRRLLEGAPAKRAEHFFTESERVWKGEEAWRSGELARFGELMTESGRSSIENYECGSEPLIDLYEILIRTPGVYGARFSGGGFRGCCVALLEEEAGFDYARETGSRHDDGHLREPRAPPSKAQRHQV